MKKAFLICSILFSCFTASANNDLVTENEEEVVRGFPCTEQWVSDVENLMDMCATFEEACVIADRAFDKCLDETYCN
ncbi:hypothetical protein [Flavobacterium sp.]|jgi:hypothetical protein|uniref:hypothetical protein n=1 Tax=Flavobacterium sp. TaxID=239 RepID=UPI0037C15D59